MKAKIISVILLALLSSCGPSLMKVRPSLKEAGQNYVNAHPDLDPRIKEAILKGEIVVGMTREEVQASLGDPGWFTMSFETGQNGRYGRYAGQCHHWHYRHCVITFGEDGRVLEVK